MLIIVIVSCSEDEAGDGSKDDTSEVSEASSVAEEILKLVNEHRKSVGKEALSFNTLANTLAKEHSMYMIEQNDISHDGFEDRSVRLNKEEQAVGTAENVAFKYTSAQAVVTGWINSTRHKQNIEGNYTETGISAIKNESGTYFFTQIFLNK